MISDFPKFTLMFNFNVLISMAVELKEESCYNHARCGVHQVETLKILGALSVREVVDTV